jgi:ABC-type amino acid transport substrate-binding protein
MTQRKRIGWLAAFLAVTLAIFGAWAPAARAQEEPPPAADDWARVKADGTLLVGTAADYPPFEFYNSNFELDGFDIALMREMGKRLGVTVAFNDFAFSGLLDALRLGQVDAAVGAISVTPDRQQLVDFTNLYFIGESAAVARAESADQITSATDLSGKKVGVEAGTTFQSWAQANLVDAGLIAQEDLVPYETVNAMTRDLRNRTIDVALMGLLTAEDTVKRFTDLEIFGKNFAKQQYAIAARKDSSLIEELNQVLLEMQADGTFAELVSRYLQADPEEVTPSGEAAQVDNSVVVTPTVPVTATEPAPPPCIYGMAYVADLNLDDQNMTAPPVMQPGQDFAKSWRVKNSGTCAWEPDFELAFVNGNRAEANMSGQPLAMGRVIEPGEVGDLTVSLRAPNAYGVFQGFWQMRDSNDQYFGEVVWVGIQVPDPNPPPAPPPPPSGPNNPNVRADANYINPGQCTTIRWDVDNVSAVYFVDGGNQQGAGGHDARTVCPSATTTYIVRVVGQNGASADYPITIYTTGGSGSYSINFWADRGTIDRGQCTALRWDVQGVREVYLNDEGVPGVSTRDVCPGSTTTYTLRVVKQDGGQETRQVTINVNNAEPPRGGPDIHEFSVSSNFIGLGQCVTLKWRTGDTDGVNILRSAQPLLTGGPKNGDYQDCPQAPGVYDYTLDAYGNGHNQKSLTVEVAMKQPR